MNLKVNGIENQDLPKFVGTQSDIVSAIKYYRSKINRLAHRTSIILGPDIIDIYDDEWTTISPGVKCIECVCSAASQDSTIVNIKVDERGEIEIHEHDRKEIIYVLEGEYIDTVSGISYSAGEVQIIPPNTKHALKSEGCLLTVVWKPAYEKSRVKHGN